MGKLRKRYNWKARQQLEHTINSEKINIEVDLNVQKDKYDASNALVLPSKKEKAKVIHNQPVSQPKPLSKTQRRKLLLVQRKKQGEKKRKQLFEDLKKVQATNEELTLMTSITQMQTKGFKRFLSEGSDSASKQLKINSIKGSNKLKTNYAEVLSNDSNTDSSDNEVEASECNSETNIEESVDTDIGNKKEEFTENVKINNKDESKDKIKNSENITKHDLILNNSEEKMESKKTNVTQISTKYVAVHRTEEVQKSRLSLPIVPEEQLIMEAIYENPIIVICGQTGSGKTTQVPQFLYEAGYASEGMIGITEPRRVAAVAMSQRVAYEMNLSSKEVSYQIRFEGNVTNSTKIKFMTDGVLLKEIQKDFLLTNYKVIIIDEAHERSVHSDLLIGLLSGVTRLRTKRGNPLKLIIMSATLRIEDFTENKKLFKITPPVIKIDSRQYPVNIHFNKRTPIEDYLGETYRKVCKIHKELPEGGILVFVTGREEVNTLCRKLRNNCPYSQKKKIKKINKTKTEESNDELNDIRKLKNVQKQYKRAKQDTRLDLLPDIDLNNYSVQPMDEEMLLEQAASDDDNDLTSDEENEYLINSESAQPLYVIPLYSMLSSEKQAKVFQPPPDGSRLCVVATNVAETSLTIPNIKYVVDTGKVKMRIYDKISGISTFIVTWTSKASANQRAGRAGRTGPGHCYRLYSSAVFNDELPKFSPPEITRRPIDDIMLYMKVIGIKNVVNFPFPTAPDLTAIKATEERLILLGALEKEEKTKKSAHWCSKVTPLGRTMAHFSINPRYAKMIAYSSQNNIIPYTIAIVAALSVREIFIDAYLSSDDNEHSEKFSEKQQVWKNLKTEWAGSGHSLGLGDVMVFLQAVGTTEFLGGTERICEKYGVRHKAMLEIRKLRKQLTNEVNILVPHLNLCVNPKMDPPLTSHSEMLRKIVLHGVVDHVARRIPENEIKEENKHKWKNAYECLEVESPVFIHPNSVLNKHAPAFVVYQEIFETSKLYMRVVTAIEPEWLPLFAPQLCSMSKPLEDPVPTYDNVEDEIFCHMTSKFGWREWSVPAVELKYPRTIERFKWFARFFLEGKVVCLLKKYSKVLLCPPATMIKSWARLQPRTQTILNALVKKEVDSKKAVLDIWEKEPKYLLDEYCEWLPEALHYEISNKWPPLS